MFRRKGGGGRPEITAIVSSAEGIADLPRRSDQDLVNLFAGERSVFAGAGASWLNNRSSWRLGGWVRTDQQPVIDGSDSTEMNYGVYGVFGWADGTHAWNVRAGLANEKLSLATRFAAVAYHRRLSIGTMGIGVAHTYIAQYLRERKLDPAFDSEMFLRVPLGDTAHITPSPQYVVNPLRRGADGPSSSDALIAGIRFHWAY